MRLLHSAMCCMAVLALCAVFAVMPAAAARPSAVGAHEDRGVINIFSSPDCTVGGPSSSRFTVDRCEPVPLYFNTGYAWMIVRARSDTHATHWQILAFKGGNCNGQGDAAIKPDAFLVGAGNTCTAAGALGSFNFNSVTVTVDPLPAPVATGAISLCADSGCANSIGSVPFTSGACMTIAYWNQNYSSVVFTTSGDSEWLIQAFKGINCNGEYPGEADAIMQGQAGACTQAGDIGTYNLKAFVVTIDPQQQRHRKIDSLKRGAARAAVADPIDSCMPTLTQCISNCRASGQDAWCDWTCRFNYRQCVSKAPPNPAAVLNSLRPRIAPAVDPCLPPLKQCIAKCRAESQDLWCDAGCDADYDMCEAALKYPRPTPTQTQSPVGVAANDACISSCMEIEVCITDDSLDTEAQQKECDRRLYSKCAAKCSAGVTKKAASAPSCPKVEKFAGTCTTLKCHGVNESQWCDWNCVSNQAPSVKEPAGCLDLIVGKCTADQCHGFGGDQWCDYTCIRND